MANVPTLTIHKSLKDGLMNVASGLGTGATKRAHNIWSYPVLNDWQHFEAAYSTSWLARNIVDCIAEDATREWREIKCKDADKIREEEDRLQVPTKVLEAFKWARLYGGAGILMITDQPLDRPLNMNAIKKGGLKNLIVLDRFYLTPEAKIIFDPTSPDFLLPSYYLVAGSVSGRVHQSHVARFDGESLPIRLRMANATWGDSSLRKAIEPIEDFLTSTFGVAESLQEFNVDIIKRQGMFEDLSSDQDEAIKKRFETFRLMKSIVHLALLDDTETFERRAVEYGGVSEMIRTLQQILAGASKTPLTKLFGESPTGLNATGEGDRKNYNETLRSAQSSQLDPALRKLDEVLVRSAIGNFPSDFNYEWKPLYSPTEFEEANANKIQADADIAYLEANVITVSQIQRNLQAKEKYSFNDDRIEELEKIEESRDLEDLVNEQVDKSTEKAIEGSGLQPEGGKQVSGGTAPNTEDDNERLQNKRNPTIE